MEERARERRGIASLSQSRVEQGRKREREEKEGDAKNSDVNKRMETKKDLEGRKTKRKDNETSSDREKEKNSREELFIEECYASLKFSTFGENLNPSIFGALLFGAISHSTK